MTALIDPLMIRSASMARPVSPARSQRSASMTATRRPQSPRRGRTAMSPVRVRQRLAVALVAGVAFVSVFAVWNSVVSADGDSLNHSEVPRTVIAQPGDTIWAIARRVMPEGNINQLVDQLVKLNGATITVGQSIRIP